jgi:hypothetical protein
MAYYRIWSTPTEGTTVINHTYDVAEESGLWYVVIDDDITRNMSYRTAKAARRIADKLTAACKLWTGVFAIETRIAEALKDEPWPYGATCINHGTDTAPSWVLTEPYRVDDEAVRTVNPDPTGYVQINVYTRSLYETACRIAEIEPDTDESISNEFCDCGHGQYVPEDLDPTEAIKIRLGYRRSMGIQIEETTGQNAHVELLKEADLMIDHYTRAQYTAACAIMGTPVLDDAEAMLVLTLDVVKDLGIGVVAPDIPHDTVTVNLAYRRVMGIAIENNEKNSGDDIFGDDK